MQVRCKSGRAVRSSGPCRYVYLFSGFLIRLRLSPLDVYYARILKWKFDCFPAFRKMYRISLPCCGLVVGCKNNLAQLRIRTTPHNFLLGLGKLQGYKRSFGPRLGLWSQLPQAQIRPYKLVHFVFISISNSKAVTFAPKFVVWSVWCH